MTKTVIVVSGLLAAFFIVSCENKGPENVTDKKMAAVINGSTENELLSVSGNVLEVADGKEFTYIKIETDAGEKWAAVPLTEVKVGEAIKITGGEILNNFPSKSLGRTFPELIISMSVEGKPSKVTKGPSSASPHGSFPAQQPQKQAADSFASAMQAERGQVAVRQTEIDPGMIGSSKAIVPFIELKVKKAAGKNGYTVGELFEKGLALNGQKIKVRGQVVKVSMNIMQRNWLHIQDGTGNTQKNTHDLVVTTSAVPQKGSIVVVEGELHANRDFGAGYSYPVIVENAVISE